jgi:hypothetical protein
VTVRELFGKVFPCLKLVYAFCDPLGTKVNLPEKLIKKKKFFSIFYLFAFFVSKTAYFVYFSFRFFSILYNFIKKI